MSIGLISRGLRVRIPSPLPPPLEFSLLSFFGGPISRPRAWCRKTIPDGVFSSFMKHRGRSLTR